MTPEPEEEATDESADADGKPVQIVVKMPPGLGRAVKKAAAAAGMFPAEWIRGILRGDDLDLPEIEEDDDEDDEREGANDEE